MSAKYLHSVADENPDLHKQLGCMNGIFQLFNRVHLVSGGRRISSHNRKRLLPGESRNHGKDTNSTIQKAIEKNLKEGIKENGRTSLDSSTSSFSSSSCSSSTFSSIDCNKLAQIEPSILGNSIPRRNPSPLEPKKEPTPSSYMSQQSLDIRNVVKDSIQREKGKLSIKTKMKTERKNRVMKHVDSPRPLEVPKPVNPRAPALETTRVLGIEQKNYPLPPKDRPRFSYDGRESRDKWKSIAKLRELPRLSLDSKQSSIRRAAAASEPRSNSLLEDVEQRSDQRLSSVVARLMGLEAFPDTIDTNRCRPRQNDDPISTSSSRNTDENKHNQIPNSPKLTSRNSSSPKLRNPNSIVKPNPRFPLEPAPWSQTNGNQESQNSAIVSQESQIKSYAPSSPSVYGEIEKRLTDLEFKKSGKDLRALKQILEAMQKAREGIEKKKEESSLKHSHSGDNSPAITPTIKGTDPLKKFQSSIATVKPAKAGQNPRNSGCSHLPMESISGLRKLRTRDNADSKRGLVAQTEKDLTFRNNRVRESSHQTLCSMDKRSSAAIYKPKQTSGSPRQTSVSPRLPCNKHVMKQSLPTTQTHESTTVKRSVGRQHAESYSPSSNSKPRSRIWQQGNYDHIGGISSETRRSSHRTDAYSAYSESNVSSASQNDIEVTGNYSSEVAARLDEVRSKSGTTLATLEQPSPVSVLDAMFYTEESPSPVKKISIAFKDEDNLSDEAESNPVDNANFMDTRRPDSAPEFDGEVLENIKGFNQKLQNLDSLNKFDAEDSMLSRCERTNPTHRYVAEILLASGLFKDLGSSSTFVQLDPTAHVINPHLFHVLEQAKIMTAVQDEEYNNGKKTQSKINEKIQRKLVFDTTDEILVRVLISAGFSDPWIPSNKLGLRCLTGNKLLDKVCSEMNNIQENPECSLPYEEDAIHHDIPEVVLDIERLIFKDLICEVVSGEAGLPGRPNKHCRQLFTN